MPINEAVTVRFISNKTLLRVRLPVFPNPYSCNVRQLKRDWFVALKISDDVQELGTDPKKPRNQDVITKGNVPVMRSKVDDLSIWQSVRRYKVIGMVAMAAAFSASLDGYRKFYA